MHAKRTLLSGVALSVAAVMHVATSRWEPPDWEGSLTDHGPSFLLTEERQAYGFAIQLETTIPNDDSFGSSVRVDLLPYSAAYDGELVDCDTGARPEQVQLDHPFGECLPGEACTVEFCYVVRANAAPAQAIPVEWEVAARVESHRSVAEDESTLQVPLTMDVTVLDVIPEPLAEEF